MKHCKRCQRDLPDKSFRIKPDRHGVPRLYYMCKECSNTYAKKYAGINPPQLKRYGLTMEQYEALGNNCHLCGASGDERRMCVDHCHETGRVRGMLCGRCNTALGVLGDNETGLLKAIQYMNKTVNDPVA